jgi:hypothetical protein
MAADEAAGPAADEAEAEETAAALEDDALAELAAPEADALLAEAEAEAEAAAELTAGLLAAAEVTTGPADVVETAEVLVTETAEVQGLLHPLEYREVALGPLMVVLAPN